MWITLIRRIPEAQQGDLVVITSTGVEYMVQKVIRMAADFLILRGRVAGSSDAGRIILLPYNQISSLAINKVLLENEVEAIFGGLEAVAEMRPAAAIPSPVQAAMPTLAPVPTPAPATAAAPPLDRPALPTAPSPPSRSAAPPHKPSKSILLARLRARLAGDSSQAS